MNTLKSLLNKLVTALSRYGLVGTAAAGIALHNVYSITCFGPDGQLKWSMESPNLTVNAGLNDILQQYFKGSAYTAAFFVGIKGPGIPAAGDTMSSHGTWTEGIGYSQSTRPALVLGSVASQAVSNSASQAVFSVTTPMTVAGAFVTTNNTVGGTSGTLFGAADFTATGTVNTVGTAVTYVSGTQFSGAWAGQSITINAVVYTISSVTDATHLVLTATAGSQSGVAFSTVNTKFTGSGDTLNVLIQLSAASA